jgi:ABC-type sugar transport system ATPase subunit
MLSFDHVSKSYDGNPALKDVSFTIAAGRVVALCGENGAGKSTLINILSGAVQPDEGKIRLDDREIVLGDPRRAIELGIQTVHQDLSLLLQLSVAENILLGKMPHRLFSWVVDWERCERRAAAVLRDFGFDGIDVRTRVSDLPVSVQQIVEIAKALVVEPRILILDEPSSVLSARETELLFRKVKQLASMGATVIYISHRLWEIFEISDDIVVLKDGVNVVAGETKTFDQDSLIHAMVGRPLGAIYPSRDPAIGPPVLEVRELCKAGLFENVSFTVHAGEIVGMFGLVGSGRTDVAKAVFGASPANSGEIRVDGKAAAIADPPDAIRHGITLVTEDRKRDGLFLDGGVIDNGGLASMDRFATRGFLNRKRQAEVVSAKLDELSVRPRGARGPIRSLSGGNQQKVVLGKWMLVENVHVFIFDEPTRGVDIATKVQIYRMIADLAARGHAVLLISSEMTEVLGLSDRLLIMRRGRIVAELQRGDFSNETVFSHAAGVEMKRSV